MAEDFGFTPAQPPARAADSPTPRPSQAPSTPPGDASSSDDAWGFTPVKGEEVTSFAKKFPVAAKLMADQETATNAATQQFQELAGQGLKGALGVLEPLNVPLRYAAGAVAKAMGEDVKMKKLNYYPISAPDVTFVDVALALSEKAVGSDEEVLTRLQSQGYSARTSAALLTAYKYLPAYTLGATADFVLDPVGKVKVGGRVAQVEEAMKGASTVEDVAKASSLEAELGRRVVSVGVPLSKKEFTLTTKGIESLPGGKKVMQAAEKASDVASQAMSAFSSRTGDLVVDVGVNMNFSRKRGVRDAENMEILGESRQKNYTEGERKVILNLMETTPNQKPKVAIPERPKGFDTDKKSLMGPAYGEGPANLVTRKRAEEAVLGLEEAPLREQILARVEKAAKEEQVALSPERANDIVDSTMLLKRKNAEGMEAAMRAGKIDVNRDLSTQMVQNYFVHRVDDRVLKAMRPGKKLDAVFAVADDAERDAAKAIAKKGLNEFDGNLMYRTNRNTVREANERLRQSDLANKTMSDAGVTEWFVEDPFVATYMRTVDAKMAAYDKELIDLLETRGLKYTRRADGSRMLEPTANRATAPELWKQQQDMAGKVNYWIVPRQTGNMTAFFNWYNKVFRANVLFRPDHYLQNWAEGMYKNFAQGVKMEDYVTVSKVMHGDPNAFLTINGKTVKASELKKTILEWGVRQGNSMEEIIENTMFMAKRISGEGGKIFAESKRGLSPSKLLDGVREMGGRGENWVRESMFVNRLNQGYSPMMAAFDVEKFHFDYAKTTKSMDVLRRYIAPFIQHPIKTLQIAPELVGSNLRATNFIHNNFMRGLERAFNDPTSTAMIGTLAPSWLQMQNPRYTESSGDFKAAHDRAAQFTADYLGPNSWLAKAMTREANSMVSATGLPTNQTVLKLPIGLDALNQFASWEQQVMNGGPLSGPVLNSAMALIYGYDPFQGKTVDIIAGEPNGEQRIKAALQTAFYSALGYPNLMRAIKQYAPGLPDPEGMTPTAALMIHGSVGKFVRIENLDRQYIMRLKVLESQQKEAYKKLIGTILSESAGKSYAMSAAGRGKVLERLFDTVTPKTARDVHEELRAKQFESVVQSQAANILTQMRTGKYVPGSLEDMVSEVKGINLAIKEMNENFETLRSNILQEAREGKTADQLVDEGINGQPEEAPAPEEPEPTEEASVEDEEDDFGFMTEE